MTSSVTPYDRSLDAPVIDNTPDALGSPALEPTTASVRFLQQVKSRPSIFASPAMLIHRELLRPDLWLTATRTLMIMVRNVCVSTAIAWLANLWFSRGNIFSSQPPQKQSHASFLTAAVVSTFLCNCLLNLVVQALRLVPNKFTNAPNQRRSFLYCFWRVTRGSLVHLAVSVASLVPIGIGCAHMSLHWRKLKIEYYIAVVFTQYCYAVADMVVRRIFQDETVAGHQKRASKEKLQPTGSPLATQVRQRRSFRNVRRVFLQSLPSLISIWFAGAYIHIVSMYEFSQDIQMLVFVGVSMVIKLVVQEIAKHYVMKKNVTHIRNMCIVIGIPTVLVNTQVRIVILSMSNSSSTMLGTWLMAIIEVVLRLAKVAFLRWQIRREKTKREKTHAVVAVLPSQDTATAASDCHSQFVEWRAQMLALHTAEIYADMYAEYIAMSCSASIYFFFSGNVHYRLGVSPSSSAQASTYSTTNQALLLLLQIAVEIVVDYVSCIVEILSGIDFEHFDGFGLFLGSLFTITALLNVSMSSVLYIAE